MQGRVEFEKVSVFACDESSLRNKRAERDTGSTQSKRKDDRARLQTIHRALKTP